MVGLGPGVELSPDENKGLDLGGVAHAFLRCVDSCNFSVQGRCNPRNAADCAPSFHPPPGPMTQFLPAEVYFQVKQDAEGEKLAERALENRMRKR